MLVGGAILLAVGSVFGTQNAWSWNLTGGFVLSILILISAVCFAVYNQLLAYHPISKIAIYNALIPVLGVFFAAFLLHEQLKWQYFFAVFAVACGIWLVNRKPAAEREKQ